MHIRLWLTVFGITCLAVTNNVSANTQSPIMYSRSTVIIDIEKPVTSNSVAMNIDIRSAETTFNRSGWYNFALLKEYEGVMLVFDESQLIEIGRTNDYAPLDILFADDYGVITEIIPSIKLVDLEETIPSSSQVKVLLYLQGGFSGKLGIQPKDKLRHSVFKKRPLVITSPSQEKTDTTSQFDTQIAPAAVRPEESEAKTAQVPLTESKNIPLLEQIFSEEEQPKRRKPSLNPNSE